MDVNTSRQNLGLKPVLCYVSCPHVHTV
jgi:hypothetical protein